MWVADQSINLSIESIVYSTHPWGEGDCPDGDDGTEEEGSAAPAMKAACSSEGIVKCVKKCPAAAAGNGDIAWKRGDEGTGPT